MMRQGFMDAPTCVPDSPSTLDNLDDDFASPQSQTNPPPPTKLTHPTSTHTNLTHLTLNDMGLASPVEVIAQTAAANASNAMSRLNSYTMVVKYGSAIVGVIDKSMVDKAEDQVPVEMFCDKSIVTVSVTTNLSEVKRLLKEFPYVIGIITFTALEQDMFSTSEHAKCIITQSAFEQFLAARKSN
eukprot:GHVN01015476.1.p1 GENE.GHVN01015476.1~~GHVN01015476.1.p1  ORF type:complete len:185 (-),score=57.67 GHVN01015476.1:542-1096(-)